MVADSVLTPSCAQCHGAAGGVSLRSYQTSAASASRINQAVFVDKSMPKNGTLTSYQQAVLKAWIEEGAPENAGGPAVPTASPSPAPLVAIADLNFNNLNQKIFKTACVKCHSVSGGVDMRSYDTIKANIGKIAIAVLATQSMPKNGTLTADQLSLLSAWINAGAPELSPGTDGVQPTYASLYANVFQPLCMNCHGTGRIAEAAPLAPYAALMSSDNKLVTAGDLSHSAIVDAITKPSGVRGSMPPASAGLAPLPVTTIELIKQWILNGAPEGDEPEPSPIASASPVTAPSPSPSP
jgi:uncharacterized membrane protein